MTVSFPSLQIEVMEGELRAARQAARKSPARTTRDLVERLKNDMATKEKQYKVCLVRACACTGCILCMIVGVVCVLKALSAALVEVRTELIEVTQRAVEEKGGKKKEREEEEVESQRRMLEEKAEELQVRTG